MVDKQIISTMHVFYTIHTHSRKHIFNDVQIILKILNYVLNLLVVFITSNNTQKIKYKHFIDFFQTHSYKKNIKINNKLIFICK